MPDIIFKPIYILDETDEFMKRNGISSNTLFHTFLLDKNNRIQLLGNPISTVSMNDLYEKKIFELTTHGH